MFQLAHLLLMFVEGGPALSLVTLLIPQCAASSRFHSVHRPVLTHVPVRLFIHRALGHPALYQDV